MKRLQTVFQHRPVFFPEHVFAQSNHEVRPDTDNLAIKGGMVNLAQGQAVGNFRESVIKASLISVVVR